MPPVIDIQNLNHFFGSGALRKPVLTDINLQIMPGEIIILTGPSGSGKTTLLTLLGGLRSVQDGSLKVLGEELCGAKKSKLVEVRSRIGYIFQAHNLLSFLTAKQNVRMALELHGHFLEQDMDAIASEMLREVGLGERIDYYPDELSGGQRQRVAIARALAIRPKILVMDEPFGALDAITKEELQEELLKIWEEHRLTVLMITHDIDEALFLADRLVMMTNGPSAQIGEIMEIPFGRPRDRTRVMEDPRYYELRNQALDFLYNRFAHDDDEAG